MKRVLLTLFALLIPTIVGAQQIGTFARIVTTDPSSASAVFAGGVIAGASRNQIIDFSGRIPALTLQYIANLDASQLTNVPSPLHNLLSATHPDTQPTTPVLGMVIYADSTPQWRSLAGNTTTTKMFLSQTGNGTISAAPAWAALADADIPDTITLSNLTQIATRSHGSLQDLLNDHHTQYALLAGRASGQSLIGGTGVAEGLNLQATSGNGVGSEFVKVLVGNNGAITALNLTATVSQLGHTASPTTIITNKATPTNSDGMWWAECVGTSPSRVCAIKINDSATVRTIASVTF